MDFNVPSLTVGPLAPTAGSILMPLSSNAFAPFVYLCFGYAALIPVVPFVAITPAKVASFNFFATLLQTENTALSSVRQDSQDCSKLAPSNAPPESTPTPRRFQGGATRPGSPELTRNPESESTSKPRSSGEQYLVVSEASEADRGRKEPIQMFPHIRAPRRRRCESRTLESQNTRSRS